MLVDRLAQNLRLHRRHHAGLDVVVQGVDAAGRLADRKARTGRNRRQHPLEPLARKSGPPGREIGADDRRAGMDLGADVAGDQPDDPLDLGRRQADARIDPAFAEAVQPQDTVGIDHHLDHRRIGEGHGDVGSHRRAQHRRAPVQGFHASHAHGVASPV